MTTKNDLEQKKNSNILGILGFCLQLDYSELSINIQNSNKAMYFQIVYSNGEVEKKTRVLT